ncbi:MAG: hypothetical protein HY553_19815 [Elusimicrobia bacterium]|nr:hypothetical protein [Elusimicrobiota bacterium]
MRAPGTLRLVPIAAALAVAAVAPPEAAFVVIGLPAGTAQLRAGSEPLSLGPGSPSWALPPDTPVTVVSGGIWAQFGDTTVKARPGDGLRFSTVEGGVRVSATAGTLLLERPDGSTRHLAAGESFALTAPGAPRPPARPSGGGCGAGARR